MNGAYYTIDGQQYVRVTTVLGVIRKPFLEQWRGKVGNAEANRIAQVSTELGTRVHSVCERITLGEPWNSRSASWEAWLASLEADLHPYAVGYATWLRENVREVVSAERQIVSRRWRYAGTADLVAVLNDGQLGVLDFKTSNRLSDEYALQLAAYALGLREDGLQPTRRLVVWLPKQEPGVVRTAEYHAHHQDENAFLHALCVWRWQQTTKAQREEVYA